MRTSPAALLITVLLAAIGCSRGADRAQPAPAAEPPPDAAAAVVDAPAATRGDDGGAHAGGLDCHEPCLLLDDHALAEVRAACPAWPVASATPACDDLDFARNCVYAAHGHVFRKDRWKRAFAATSWYRPDSRFEVSSLSKLELTNIAALRREGAFCRQAVDARILPATRGALDAWFADTAAGRPPYLPRSPAPSDDFLSGEEPLTRAYLRERLAMDRTFYVRDPWESYRLRSTRGDVQVIEVATGRPDPATCGDPGDDEACGGFQYLVFVVERGTIVAIYANEVA